MLFCVHCVMRTLCLLLSTLALILPQLGLQLLAPVQAQMRGWSSRHRMPRPRLWQHGKRAAPQCQSLQQWTSGLLASLPLSYSHGPIGAWACGTSRCCARSQRRMSCRGRRRRQRRGARAAAACARSRRMCWPAFIETRSSAQQQQSSRQSLTAFTTPPPQRGACAQAGCASTLYSLLLDRHSPGAGSVTGAPCTARSVAAVHMHSCTGRRVHTQAHSYTFGWTRGFL